MSINVTITDDISELELKVPIDKLKLSLNLTGIKTEKESLIKEFLEAIDLKEKDIVFIFKYIDDLKANYLINALFIKTSIELLFNCGDIDNASLDVIKRNINIEDLEKLITLLKQ